MIYAQERYAVSSLITLALVFVIGACLSGCVPAEAILQAQREQAINLGHSADESLDQHTRAVSRDNYDAWSAQRYSLEGAKLPKDVEDRLRQRESLPEGYE